VAALYWKGYQKSVRNKNKNKNKTTSVVIKN
jgi:hypothetical protein